MEPFFVAFFLCKGRDRKDVGKLAEKVYQKISNVCFIVQYVRLTEENS